MSDQCALGPDGQLLDTSKITTVMTNVPLPPVPPTSGQNHNFGELLVSKSMAIYLHGYVLRSQPSHSG